MAEVLKEFANATLTQANFDANDAYTVLTNNSTTQVVVKDISAAVTATGLNNTNLGILSGVATIGEGGKSSGFELIPQSGTLKLKVTNTLPTGKVQDYKLYTLRTNAYHRAHDLKAVETTFYPLKAGSSYVGSFADNEVDISSGDNGSSSPSSDIVFYYQNANFRYYFNHNGNNTTQFFKVSLNSLGASSSAWTTVNSSTYKHKAIDTVNDLYFWQHDATSVFVGKLSTGEDEQKTVTGWTGAVNPASYNKSSACNHIFFVQPTYQFTTAIYYYNNLTGKGGKITGSYLGDSATGLLSVTYNSAEQRYYIFTKAGSVNKMVYLDGNSLSGDYTATLINSGNNVMSIIAAARYVGSNSSGQFAYTNSGNRAEIGLATTSGITVQYTGQYYQYEDQAGGTFAKQTTGVEIPASEADLSYSIALKVSGVEITGV